MNRGRTESLVLLGTGTAVPTRDRGPSGELLVLGDDVTLIDPGPGSVKRAFDAGHPPWTIRRVLLTHHHVDHVLDLVALLFARMNPFLDPPAPLAPLAILGGPGTEELVRGIAQLFGGGMLERGGGTQIRELGAGSFELGAPGVDSLAVPVTHSPASLAYRFRLASGSVLAISGDTGDEPGAVEVARDADHYLLEAALPKDHAMAGHVSARQAGTIAARAGCRHLILNHFYPQVDPDTAAGDAAAVFPGRVTIGRDGLVIRLEVSQVESLR